jgi:hypothetical protein
MGQSHISVLLPARRAAETGAPRPQRAPLVTDVLTMYLEMRSEGRGHNQAIRDLAAKLGVDTATAKRVVQRAERERGEPK